MKCFYTIKKPLKNRATEIVIVLKILGCLFTWQLYTNQSKKKFSYHLCLLKYSYIRPMLNPNLSVSSIIFDHSYKTFLAICEIFWKMKNFFLSIWAQQSIASILKPNLFSLLLQSNFWADTETQIFHFSIFSLYTANYSPIKSAGDPRVAKHTL